MNGHHYEDQVCGEEMGKKEKQIVHCEERWNWRHKHGQEQPNVSSLPSEGHGDVQAQVTSEAHV